MSADSMIQLRRGAIIFDINDVTHYYVRRDFIPPATAEQPMIAAGNIRADGRGTKFGVKPGTRTWSFTVRVRGESDGEVHSLARALQAFVAGAGDDADPTFLDYRSNNNVPEPVWGQFGAKLSYEILHGTAELGDDYSLGTRRQRAILARLTLTIQPYVTGREQRLCTATGGIIQDTLGSVDGLSRGVIIPEATTNKMTNPVVGHSVFGNGWTAGANLTAAENTDPEYMLPGTARSARLQRMGAANTYTQSIAAGNTNKHSLGVIVKLHGGGTLAVADVEVKYGASSVQVTPLAIGDGWYWLRYENFDGIALAQDVGVTVVTYNAVYLAIVQLEEKTYCTWPVWGDLLGCAWTSTAHDSTSTRTAATAKVPTSTALDVAQGTIRVVVKIGPGVGISGFYLYNMDTATNWHARILSTGVFDMFDDTNQIVSSAQLPSVGDILVLHYTWGPSGLSIYKNGVNIANGATYTPPTFGTHLYIGSFSNASTARSNNVIKDFTTFDLALTTTQIADDYANIAPLVADDAKVGTVPWLWTKDGDNVIDNCDDATRDNWCVVGGIPGTAPAITDLLINSSDTALDTYGTIWISNLPQKIFVPPSTLLFSDQSGTADAACCGGEKYVQSVNTSDTAFVFSVAWPWTKELMGKEIYVFVRSADAGANLTAAIYLGDGGGKHISSYDSLISLATMRLFLLGPITIVDEPTTLDSPLNTLSFGVFFKRTVAGAANVSVDYFALAPSPLLRISNRQGTIGVDRYIRLRGADATMELTTGQWAGGIDVTGSEPIEFLPDRYNTITAFQGHTLADPVITATLTFVSVKVTPRYALM